MEWRNGNEMQGSIRFLVRKKNTFKIEEVLFPYVNTDAGCNLNYEEGKQYESLKIHGINKEDFIQTKHPK